MYVSLHHVIKTDINKCNYGYIRTKRPTDGDRQQQYGPRIPE